MLIKNFPRKALPVLFAASASTIALSAAPALAQSGQSQQIAVASQPLNEALVEIGRRYGVSVYAPESLTRGKRSPRVAGDLTAKQALDRALAGTGLAAVRRPSGTFEVTQAANESRQAGQVSQRRQATDAPESEGRDEENVIVVQRRRDYLYRQEKTDALGLSIPLAELPATVNVITDDFLEDVQAYDVEDALNYIPGVINGGFVGGTNLSFVSRGFSSNATFLNGLRQFRDLQQTPSIETIDRVEIVKGPAGAELGVADPGGSLFIVTKRPEREFAAEVFGGVGTFGFRRIAGDVTGPITESGNLRYRLIASYSERAEWRDGRPDETPRWTVAPSLAWDYAPGGSLLLEYQHTFSNEPLDRGIFYLEGAGFEDNFSPREFSVHQRSDIQEIDADRYGLIWDQDIGSNFGLTIQAQRLEEDLEGFQAQFGFIGGLYLPDGLTWNGVDEEGPLFLRDRIGDNSVDNIAATLRANFDTGRVQHNLRVGYQYSDSNFNVDFGADGPQGRRTVSNTINIFNPDNDQTLNFTGRDSAVLFLRTEEINSAFGQWTADIDGRARIIAGLRYDDAELQQRFDSTAGQGTPSFNISDEISFRIAGSYDLSPNLTAFVGYSDSYTLQGGTTADGEAIDPLHNISFEGGLKIKLFNERVLWTNTIYQITQDNISAADPNDPTNMFEIPFGEVRIRGFESEFVGNVTSYLDVTAGLTIQDSTNVRTEDPSLEGNEFFGVPDLQISGFANYRFDEVGLEGFSGRLGIIHISERQGNAVNNFQLPSYVRVDLGARYFLTDNASIDVFVENLFDENYIESTQGRGRPDSGLIPGDRRLLQVNFRYAF